MSDFRQYPSRIYEPIVANMKINGTYPKPLPQPIQTNASNHRDSSVGISDGTAVKRP